MSYYLFESEALASLTAEKMRSLAKKKPEADFTEFAAGVIYERLKTNIQRYRVYGPYWWALKDVLRKYGYNVGSETDEDITATYRGSNDAETIVAADTFYLETSSSNLVTNNRWQLHPKRDDYVLYDSDMELRTSITDVIITN